MNQCEFLATTPNSLPNWGMMRLIREADSVPFGLLPAEWMLKVGALFIRRPDGFMRTKISY
jgi:hypothetical protein